MIKLRSVTIDTKPEFISRAQFRGLQNCNYRLFKDEGEVIDVGELQVGTFYAIETRDNFGVQTQLSPDGEWTYERGKEYHMQPEIFFIHTQTGERIEEEPKDWAIAQWYHMYTTFDNTRMNLNMRPDGDWDFIGFVPPNYLIFQYNTNWLEG